MDRSSSLGFQTKSFTRDNRLEKLESSCLKKIVILIQEITVLLWIRGQRTLRINYFSLNYVNKLQCLLFDEKPESNTRSSVGNILCCHKRTVHGLMRPMFDNSTVDSFTIAVCIM